MMKHKSPRTSAVSLSPERLGISRKMLTGITLIASLTRRYEELDVNDFNIYKVQKLREEMQSHVNVSEVIEFCLRHMRNKKLELTDLGQNISSATMMGVRASKSTVNN